MLLNGLLAGSVSAVIVAAAITAPVSAQECGERTICVDSPGYRSAVSGTITIDFRAPGLASVWGRAWHHPGSPGSGPYEQWFSHATPDAADGRGTLTFPADDYPHGPITLMISGWNEDATAEDHAYLQLYNAGGVPWEEGLPAAPAQASGMSVVFQDDFTAMPSISRCGAGGATYNSVKADGSEYSDAIFADREGPNNPFTHVGGEYLRMRARPAPPGTEDPMGWDRTYLGANLTSLRCDGTGVAATMGYFEVRLLAPSATGTWPAFWFLSADHIAPGTPDEAEIDTLEGYGHEDKDNYVCRGYAHWGSEPHIGGGRCEFDRSDFAAEDDFARRFHVYGMKVGQDDITYWVDNREVWRSPIFDKARGPLYFLISMALGGGWPIDLSRYGDAVDMYVDWVRVWEPTATAARDAPRFLAGDAGRPSTPGRSGV